MKNILNNDLKSNVTIIYNNKRTENVKVILLLLFLSILFSSDIIYAKNSSTLRGKISAKDKISLSNSSICISNNFSKVNVMVDDEGYYYCNNLKAGNYTVVYASNGSRVVNDIIIKENLMHKLNISVSETNSSLVLKL